MQPITFGGDYPGDDLHGRLDSRRGLARRRPGTECHDNDDSWDDENGGKPDNGWDDEDDPWDECGGGQGDQVVDDDEDDWDDEAKLYRDFLDNLHSCQVECSDDAAAVVRGEFRRFEDAIVDGSTAGSSEEVASGGRIRWRGVMLDWSIHCFDRTELYGWNEFGYPEDFIIRLFIVTAKEADFNDHLAEDEWARQRP